MVLMLVQMLVQTIVIHNYYINNNIMYPNYLLEIHLKLNLIKQASYVLLIKTEKCGRVNLAYLVLNFYIFNVDER